MKTKSIQKGSIAYRIGVSPGDELLEIDGHPVRDVIDYRFLSTEDRLQLKLRSPSGRIRTLKVKKQPDQDLGMDFCPIRYRGCRNNCIFCFVHQLPKGLRKQLYFKDEDFRLSFLHGNFITLTNTSREDIERIINQRLSPIYVSVHATHEELRRRILGNPNIPDIMPQIQQLAKGRIEMHMQIVLCPGINDGKHLEKSVRDLSALYPHVRSLALVPVGLTKFRSKLPKIRSVGKAYSQRIIELVDSWQKTFRKELGAGFVYGADEFYTKAEIEIPSRSYYDEFYQIENGVGMLRQFVDDLQTAKKFLPIRLRKDIRITLVTGVSAYKTLKQIVRKHLSTIPGLKVQIVRVENDFFGHSVTVTGLLTGRDIIAALRKKRNLGEVIFLPPNCVNDEGLFLDDLTEYDFAKEFESGVVVGILDLYKTLAKFLKAQIYQS